MMNIINFMASFKWSWIKKLTQGYKPGMDLFLLIDDNDFGKNFIYKELTLLTFIDCRCLSPERTEQNFVIW